MAIDFLILFLLIISFVVNLLALGAFWVTPGLRTTANRFTINLLVVNLVGCLILAPTLFLCGEHGKRGAHESGLLAEEEAAAATATTATTSLGGDSIEILSQPGNRQFTIRHNGAVVEQDGVSVRRHDNESDRSALNDGLTVDADNDVEGRDDDDVNDVETIRTIFKRNSTFYQELTIDERRDAVVITAIEEQEQDPQQQQHPRVVVEDAGHLQDPFKLFAALHLDGLGGGLGIGTGRIRCWTIDLVAALGALAVLLVVGDTWCAVTDPLRYHTRISAMRTWIFIALIWAVGVFFGALSALREVDFEAAEEQDRQLEDDALSGSGAGAVLSKQRRFIAAYTRTYLGSIFGTNSLFGMAFACLYFVVIILLPFGFVCGMYWRIFSEARENGLRMRQNGSSPLLQSALNLTHHAQQQQQQQQLQYAASNAHRNSVSSNSSHGGGGGGGLQLQIDAVPLRHKSSPACLRRDSAAKVLLPTISDDGGSEEANSPANGGPPAHHQVPGLAMYGQYHQHEMLDDAVAEEEPRNSMADRHLNILLTLQSASGEIKRNYSARQLPLLGTSSQDLREADGLPAMRQVHSSPNLCRYEGLLAGGNGGQLGGVGGGDDALSDDGCSPHLLGPDTLILGHNGGAGGLAGANRHHRFQLMHQHHHHRSLPHSGGGHTSGGVMRHHAALQHHHHALQIPSIHASPKALSYMTSLRHRLSNASSLFKYREESRAARISILVVIMFLVSYLPYGFLVLLQSRLPAANFAHSTQLAIFMIVCGTISSPVIFAYRNQRVRRGVKRLFGREWRGSEHTLQRQGSGGIKHGASSGSFIGGASGGGGGNIRRNGSKLSTYSTGSGKYLTPQTSVISNGGPTAATPALRANSSCSTIINLGGNTKTHAFDEEHSGGEGERLAAVVTQTNAMPAINGHSSLVRSLAALPATPTPTTPSANGRRSRPPMLQRGITIVEHIPLGTKFSAKHNFFKLFFQSSRNLGCAAAAAAQTCAQAGRGDPEPAEV